MIIDSVADKSTINIDKLTIPEVKTETFPTFDPEKEITQAEGEEALKLLGAVRDNALAWFHDSNVVEADRQLTFFGQTAMALGFFFPEKSGSFSRDNGFLRVFLGCLNPTRTSLSHSLELSVMAKFLFPGHNVEISKVLGSGFLELITSVIESKRSLKLWSGYFGAMETVAQFFPGKLEVEELTKEEWVEFANELEWARPLIGKEKTLKTFVKLATEVKILFPEKMKLIGLDRKTWQTMNEWLKKYKRAEMWGEYFTLAYCMNILAADEVKIAGDGGIEVVMPKQKEDMEEKIPEMPVKRKF